MKKISKVNLFLELAQPDKTGNSRKVLVSDYWHNIKKFNQEISKIKDDKGE